MRQLFPSLLCSFALFACAADPENSNNSGTQSNDVVQADAPKADDTVDYIQCIEANVDHGAGVIFKAVRGTTDIKTAIYTQADRATTTVVGTMELCTKEPEPKEVIPDVIVKTHQCRSERDRYVVDLRQGGLIGGLSVRLYNVGREGELFAIDKSFFCTHVSER